MNDYFLFDSTCAKGHNVENLKPDSTYEIVKRTNIFIRKKNYVSSF